jgi:hypothetical protein
MSEAMTKPLIIQPSIVLAIIAGWLGLLAGAFALGLHLS